MLVAGSPFDQSFFGVTGLHAVVARHAHDFRHDRQAAKFGANLVERQPKFRASGHSCRFHVADVPLNLCSRRQIDPAAGFERLERLHFELGVFLCALGAQLIFEPHQKLRPRSNSISFNRQPVPLSIRLLPLLVWRLCCRFSWRF